MEAEFDAGWQGVRRACAWTPLGRCRGMRNADGHSQDEGKHDETLSHGRFAG